MKREVNLGSALINKLENLKILKFIQAFFFARNVHSGQQRKTGEPFIYHPIYVALLTFIWTFNFDYAIAGLLHDTVEDTDTSLEHIKNNFSRKISDLVDILTVPTGLNDDEKMKFIMEKLRNGLIKYPNIMVVKIADQIHNLKTLKGLSPNRQRRYILIAEKYYLPIARKYVPRLLLNKYKRSIEKAKRLLS